jgi:hypothetical protein
MADHEPWLLYRRDDPRGQQYRTRWVEGEDDRWIIEDEETSMYGEDSWEDGHLGAAKRKGRNFHGDLVARWINQLETVEEVDTDFRSNSTTVFDVGIYLD